jgi:VWFA-related protein
MFRLFAAAIAAAALVASSNAPQDPQVFRGRTDTIRVFTTVLDHEGRLDTSLAQNDFEIRDEGKPQSITLFDNTPQPVHLVVMLDVSGSMQGNLELLRRSAEALLDRLRPDDLVRIGSFGKDVKISGSFTTDRRELLAALPTFIPPDAPTPLWRAMDEAMDTFAKQDDQRRVVLVMTDGKDSGMFEMRKRVSSQAGVIDRARDEDVMVYAVGMHSRPPRQMGPMDLRQAVLQDLPDPGLPKVAEETGGGYAEIRGGDDLTTAFAHVADELHAQYLLGYAPPKRDGKVHKIEVRLNKPGLKARARRSYVAPKG